MTIIILLMLIPYLTVGGYVGHGIAVRGRASCDQGGHGGCWHKEAGFFGGILWAPVLPVLLGVKVSKKTNGGIPRVEKRRQTEIAEAEHKLQLAQIQAKELEIAERSVRMR